VSIEYAKQQLQLLELFDGKLSLQEIDDMDVPLLNSLIEARLQLINEREEATKRQQAALKAKNSSSSSRSKSKSRT
jgi:hypothetical protein